MATFRLMLYALLLAQPLVGMAAETQVVGSWNLPPQAATTIPAPQADDALTLGTAVLVCNETLRDAVAQNQANTALIQDCEGMLEESQIERDRVQGELAETREGKENLLRALAKITKELAKMLEEREILYTHLAVLEATLAGELSERSKYASPEELRGYLPAKIVARLHGLVPVTRNYSEVIWVELPSDICGGAPLRCMGKGFGSDAEYVRVFDRLNPSMVQGKFYGRGMWKVPVCRTNRVLGDTSEAPASEQVVQAPKLDVQATKPVSTPPKAAHRSERVATRVTAPHTRTETSRPKANTVAKAGIRKQDLRNWAREECAKSPTCARTMTASTKPAGAVQHVAHKPAGKTTTKPVAQKPNPKPEVATSAQEAVRALTEKSGTTLSPSNVTGGCNTPKIQSDSKCWVGVKGTSAKVDLTPKAASEISAALSKAQKASI